MTTISINKKVATLNNSSIDEVLLMLVLYNKCDLESAETHLIAKGLVTKDTNSNKWALTKKGGDLIQAIIVDSDKIQEPELRLNMLACKLKNIFPKGKKEGTNYYWADGVAIIIRRLKLFFKKYGNDYTDDQITIAAEKYIKSFNGNYKYMKLLKYFIFKEKVGVNGEVEGDSDLVNYIENDTEENNLSNDWISELR